MSGLDLVSRTFLATLRTWSSYVLWWRNPLCPPLKGLAIEKNLKES